ncbi:acyltransferase [Acinetobacter guillouiae]|uniref:acyltransferase n=1 Tax=Acinetobacter guillouiae TaxID=106649 RepID=UPI001CD6E894|nr:acyltransferase family protein [Acinetobacter guillouiae]
MENKLIWLDNLRVTACIMVVILHVSAIYVLKTQGQFWEIGNFVDSFVRVCVPLFFLISGYLFFQKKQVKLNNFFRLGVPLLFYSFVGVCFTGLSYYFGFVKNLNYNFISYPTFYHLWYFYPLLLIYFISYFVSVRDFKISKTSLFGFFMVFFIFCNPEINNIINILFGFKVENFFFINSEFFYYLLYAFLGAALRNVDFSKKEGYFFALVYVLSSLLICFFTSFYKKMEFYSFSGPLVALGAISIFIYFKSKSITNTKSKNFTMLISKYSLGIYCVHAFILLIIEKIFNIKVWNPLVGIFTFSIIILVLSLFVSMLIRFFDKKSYIS